jgi:hypothetical protein
LSFPSSLTSVAWPPLPFPHHHPSQWLEIKPGDDEKTIARKKKLLKSYKSKKRFQQMDIKQKERADSWQSFLKGKGSKPKQGGCWESWESWERKGRGKRQTWSIGLLKLAGQHCCSPAEHSAEGVVELRSRSLLF